MEAAILFTQEGVEKKEVIAGSYCCESPLPYSLPIERIMHLPAEA
jgi:hypothetical protein